MPSAAAQRVALGLLCAVFAVHFLDRQILAVLITPIKAEFALSDTALGLLSGFAFTVLFSVAALVIARIADRVDRARVIAISLLVFSMMTSLCGLASSFAQLLAARAGVGLGEGGTNPASHALIADLFPTHERASAMALYAAGPHLGLVLAFGAGGWLGQAVGWRLTFMIVGAVGVVLAVLTNVGLRDPRSPAAGATHPNTPVSQVLASLMQSRSLRHLFAAATLATAAGLGAVTWLPALLGRVHGMPLAHAGLYLALTFGVAGAACTVALGRFADKASERGIERKARVTAACQALLAVLWVPALLAQDRTIALWIAIVPCALMGAFMGPTLAMVQDAADPRARALSAAILLLVINLVGIGAGPLIVGALSDALAPSMGPRALAYALLAVPVMAMWSALHFVCAGRAAGRS